MSRARARILIAVLGGASLLAAWGPAPAWAQAAQVGTAQHAVGTLLVTRPEGIEARLQGRGAVRIFERDVLSTGPGSQALVELADGFQVALNENTTVRLVARVDRTKGTTRILRVRQGEVWVKTLGQKMMLPFVERKALEVETPVSNAAVRDGEFTIKVAPDGRTVLTGIQGTVELATPFGTCTVRASTASESVRGKSCTSPEPADGTASSAWTSAVLR